MYTHAYLDAGHSGTEPTTDEYLTAPAKLFTHLSGDFHQGSTFYEGVKNRGYINRIYQILSDRGNVIPVLVHHPWLDTPLHHRVRAVNYEHDVLKKKGIFFSEHSNATPQHTARGFSAWTSIGQTMSDKLADNLLKRYKKTFSVDGKRIKCREDLSDGDMDYEANFYVLAKTSMPAVLSENLFFDQIDDAHLLMDTGYKEAYCEMVADWIEWSINYLNRRK
jgi:N-acetylmuramoyl-L-alanine amidase